jgi:DNA invertase Pin-like site-specific DNA recombinase
VYAPTDPMGKCIFHILAPFAGFEVDLLRMRIGWRSPWRTASSKGKQPKLTAREHAYLPGTHNGAERSIAELAELLSVSRVTIYRALNRARAGIA